MATSDAGLLYFVDLDEGTVPWGVECGVDQTEMIEYA